MAAPGDPQWKARIAAELGVNLTPEVSHFFDAWKQAEGGSAANNPFNTTQNAPGATTYNSLGVRNYTSPDQGIAATAQTLQNGHYGNILAALKKGASARDMAQALANSPWGTGALVLKVLGEAPSAPPSTPTNPSAPGMESAPPPLPGMQQPAMMSSLQSLINNAAPSQGTRNILASLGGTAAKVAQASSAPITIPTLPSQRQLPNYDPGSLPGVPSNPAGGQAPQAPLPRNIGGIAKTALTQLGQPYQWGGPAKLGTPTDCSGLLQASAAANGVNIGRTTYEQWKEGTKVPLNKLKPGDAVFFHMGPQGPEHVAIYIGNGRVVEDPHTGSTVHISDLGGRGAVGARRYTKG
jgi:cell wall-associated NlpC family hydrolase